MTLGDRVVVMRAGKIEQVGSPEDVYRRPRTRFAADFVGIPTSSKERSGGSIRQALSSIQSSGQCSPMAGAGIGLSAQDARSPFGRP